jgi:hypothetical protein
MSTAKQAFSFAISDAEELLSCCKYLWFGCLIQTRKKNE